MYQIIVFVLFIKNKTAHHFEDGSEKCKYYNYVFGLWCSTSLDIVFYVTSIKLSAPSEHQRWAQCKIKQRKYISQEERWTDDDLVCLSRFFIDL